MPKLRLKLARRNDGLILCSLLNCLIVDFQRFGCDNVTMNTL
jgi:hypothetical protein